MSLNLTSLGAELDAIRRTRAPSSSSFDSTSTGTSPSSPTVLSGGLPTLPEPAGAEVEVGEEKRETPYPLCLLCFARPPTAVLLPCCHMNLCYLCAPALIARNRPSCPQAMEDDAPPRTDRVPYNVALARAMRKSSAHTRKLGMGGFIPPELGSTGGEFEGKDVLNSTTLRSSREESGRVQLSTDGGAKTGTQCLVCRTGVEGWLRVYTG